MNRLTTHSLLTGLLALAPALMPGTPRKPLGIYAVVNVGEYQADYLKTHPAATLTDFETYLSTTVYPDLLSNPAVSGIALYETWATLNPLPPSKPTPYDWNLMDDLFTQVALWNKDNPSKTPKTIQLVPTPGFNSPAWLMDQINSCNFLFDRKISPPTSGGCGKATFSGFKEGGDTGGTPIAMDLPMPWDPTYKSEWQTFLTQLATRYGSNPSLVSISVAGPTASSEEMILPASQNIDPTATQIGGLTPEQMWDALLAHAYTNPALLQTDVGFIDEWKKAIDMYGMTFSGLTLIMTTGDGLPNLTTCKITSKTPCTFTLPLDPITDFATVCPVANMDCAAETTILEYFKQSTVGGANAKATQTDGMKGSGSAAFNLGVPSVKLISQSTDLYTSPSKQILGGAQFATSFSNFAVEEGCTSVFPPKGYASPDDVPVGSIPSACLNPNNTTTLVAAGFIYFNQKAEAAYLISPEQAEYNVLVWYFDGTATGPFFGATLGSAPLNYVQIYGPDISYANKSTTKVPVMVTGSPVMLTAQDLLNLANAGIGTIAEHP